MKFKGNNFVNDKKNRFLCELFCVDVGSYTHIYKHIHSSVPVEHVTWNLVCLCCYLQTGRCVGFVCYRKTKCELWNWRRMIVKSNIASEPNENLEEKKMLKSSIGRRWSKCDGKKHHTETQKYSPSQRKNKRSHRNNVFKVIER